MLVVGMDVHKDTVAVCAIDEAGRPVARTIVENTRVGHRRLTRWITGLGAGVERCGLEHSGGIATVLARSLQSAGWKVVAVPPRLSARENGRLRTRGKSDPADALAVARVVLREPKLPEVSAGSDKDLKLLVDYRDQLWGERTRTANRLHADLAIAYPGYQRSLGRALTTKRSLQAAEDLVAADNSVRAELDRARIARLHQLDAEIKDLERRIGALVEASASSLVSIVGISALTAARILGEVGDVRRFPTSSTFASVTGTSPIPASSGRTERHRLNRGGNRRLNRALYVVALTQTRHEPRAVAYLERKRNEGKTRREAMRCLKRRLSDVVYRQMLLDAGALDHRS